MSRSFCGTALLSAVMLMAGAALVPPSMTASDSPLQLAELAWDRGDYPAALTGFLQLLDSPQGDSVLEPIAQRADRACVRHEIPGGLHGGDAESDERRDVPEDRNGDWQHLHRSPSSQYHGLRISSISHRGRRPEPCVFKCCF